jgi:WD40 repeat protein
VPPVYDEQHCASLWLFDPAAKAGAPAIEGSVLAVSSTGSRDHHRGGSAASSASPRGDRPMPARASAVLRLWTPDSLAPQATFHLRRGPVGSSHDRGGLEPYYVLMDPVMVMNNLAATDPHLEGHYPETVSAVISPDGTRMAAWSWDNTIQLWDLANGRVAGRLAGHQDGIIAASIAPGGDRLASSSWDRTLRVWDLAQAGTTATIATDPVVTSVVFSPDGRRLAWGDRDGRVFVAEAANPAAAESSAAHRGAVRSLAFSPDARSGVGDGGRRLAADRSVAPLGELRGLTPVVSLGFGELRLFGVGRTPM